MRSHALVVVPVLLAWAPATAPSEEVFRFQDPAIVESSGLVVSAGRFLTVNDSGNDPVLYVVDPGSGETVDSVEWAEDNVDAEALAPAPDGDVWVGDIGDNDRERETISVIRVALDGDTAPTAYLLAYPDGRHDAESLLADPESGRLYVVTKGLLGGEVYAAPEVLDAAAVNPLEPLGRVLGLATDGAFLPDGRHLILRDYGRAVVYRFPGLEEVGDFPLPSQPQGEALAVAPDGSVYVGSEGEGTPVYRVEVPGAVLRALRAEPPQASVAPSDQPSAEPSDQPSAKPSTRPSTELSTRPWERQLWAWAILAVVAAGAAAALGVRRRRHGRR